jgi:hypothetical protein
MDEDDGDGVPSFLSHEQHAADFVWNLSGRGIGRERRVAASGIFVLTYGTREIFR